jgi:hypothetical protein
MTYFWRDSWPQQREDERKHLGQPIVVYVRAGNEGNARSRSRQTVYNCLNRAAAVALILCESSRVVHAKSSLVRTYVERTY